MRWLCVIPVIGVVVPLVLMLSWLLSLLLPLLSPRCCPIVSVVPLKRPPAPVIPPVSSGSQWQVHVLGCCVVGGLCRSLLAISTPQSTLQAVAHSGGGGCWSSLSRPLFSSSLSSLSWLRCHLRVPMLPLAPAITPARSCSQRGGGCWVIPVLHWWSSPSLVPVVSPW